MEEFGAALKAEVDVRLRNARDGGWLDRISRGGPMY